MTDDPPRDETPGRACRRVRDAIDRPGDPARVSPRAWWTRRHLGRCPACAEEWATRQRLAAGLAEVVAAPPGPAEDPGTAPPEGLLEGLLEQAADQGLRAKAAVPMRGAVSGARPVLTLTLLLFAGLVGVLAAYATWRATRMLRRGR